MIETPPGKRFRSFRFIQLLLILLLPFLLQFSLGGFAASSTVMIWAILSPVGALMFAGTSQALLWFLAYLALMIISGILDGMMVIFPERQPLERSQSAVQAALEIREHCLNVSEEKDSTLLPIKVNIGICSGEVYIGPTKMRGKGGSRWTFTASGPVTVMAARLSDYAQGGQILVGEETARRIGKAFPMAFIGKVTLKNFRHPANVYQVAGP